MKIQCTMPCEFLSFFKCYANKVFQWNVFIAWNISLYQVKRVCNVYWKNKKITQLWRRWGTPENFCLAFIDELEKQLFIKNLLKWVNRKCKNFNIYNVFFKKNKEKHLEIYFTSVYQKSWLYDLQFLRYRVW